MELDQKHIVADLGCGSGVFTIPLSERVKKVYAIDVEPKMIEAANQKIMKKKITNIKTMLSYDNKIPTSVNSIYDVASVTKIAASLLALMQLQAKNKLSLDLNLCDYLPDLIPDSSEYGNLNLREILEIACRL